MASTRSLERTGHVLAFVFMVVLLFAAKGHMQIYPLEAGLLLLVFAVLYLIGLRVPGRSGFLYPTALLCITAYYLFLYRAGVRAFYYPLLALPVVGVVYGLGQRQSAAGEAGVSRSLYRISYWVTLYFTLDVLRHITDYVQMRAWAGVIALIGFAGLYGVRYRETRNPRIQYPGLVLGSLALILTLHALPSLPTPYHGLFLMGWCMGMMAVGSRYHSASGFVRVKPLYIVGQILSFAAFIYAVRDPTALLITLFLFAAHYFGISRSVALKPTAARFYEMLFYKTSFGLANLGAYVCILLLAWYRFPSNTAAMIATFGLGLVYWKVALDRKHTVFEARNQYAYFSVFFLTVFYLMALHRIHPLGEMWFNLLLSLPFLFALLSYAYTTANKGRKKLSDSIYEASSIAVGAILLVSLLSHTPLTWGGLLAVLIVGIILFFTVRAGQDRLLYGIPLVGAYVYYEVLATLSVRGAGLGLYFVPIGLLTMGIALYLRTIGHRLSGVFFFAWFLLSGISIYASVFYRLPLIYVLSIWAVSFLIGATQWTEKEVQGPRCKVQGLQRLDIGHRTSDVGHRPEKGVRFA